jgi:hypothetical protein
MMYELEKQGKAIPESSYLEDIEANDGGIVMQISCDTQYYFNRFAEMSAGINAAIPL